ncbi:hypothetical protein CYMTET_44852, partial [Cymbomonas tetramitiformis]
QKQKDVERNPQHGTIHTKREEQTERFKAWGIKEDMSNEERLKAIQMWIAKTAKPGSMQTFYAHTNVQETSNGAVQ